MHVCLPFEICEHKLEPEVGVFEAQEVLKFELGPKEAECQGRESDFGPKCVFEGFFEILAHAFSVLLEVGDVVLIEIAGLLVVAPGDEIVVEMEVDHANVSYHSVYLEDGLLVWLQHYIIIINRYRIIQIVSYQPLQFKL